MSFKVQLQSSGHEFEVEGKETILRAGMRQGLNLAHKCMNGSCGECTARLLKGDIRQLRNHDYRLAEQQKNEGVFLTCCYQPLSNLLLEMHEKHDPVEMLFQEILVKVTKLERLQDEVMLLQLRAPRSKVLDFLGGQRVSLCLPNGSCEVLGVANCPCEGVNLRFHIRLKETDFSQHVFNGLRKGDSVQLFGPVGNFTLNEYSSRKLIFFASETGFAQVQSIIDHAISIDPDREITLYWLSAIERGHYLSNYCRAWRDTLDNFCYESIDLQPAGKDTLETSMQKLLSQEERINESDIYAILPENELVQLTAFLEQHQFPIQQLTSETLHSI